MSLRETRIYKTSSEKPRGYLYNAIKENSYNINYKKCLNNLNLHVSDEIFDLEEWNRAIEQWEIKSISFGLGKNCPCSHEIKYSHPIVNKFTGKILGLGIDCIQLFIGPIKTFYNTVRYINDKIIKEEYNLNKKKIMEVYNILNDIHFRNYQKKLDFNEYNIVKECLKYRPNKFKQNWSNYKRNKFNELKNEVIKSGKHAGCTYNSRSKLIEFIVNNGNGSQKMILFVNLKKQISSY